MEPFELKARILNSLNSTSSTESTICYTAEQGYCAPLGQGDGQLNSRTVARFAVGLARWICAEAAAGGDIDIETMFLLGYPVGHIARSSGEGGEDFVAIIATACRNLRIPDCAGHAWLDAFPEPIKREQLARFAQADGMAASVYVRAPQRSFETASILVYGNDGQPLKGTQAERLSRAIADTRQSDPEVRRILETTPRIPSDCCDDDLHSYLLGQAS